jgi:uncharacterized protein (UPF0210 family)
MGPDSDWNQADLTVPWWQDNRFIIGSLTSKTRQLRIINTLTKHDNVIECADEESINEILDRYLTTNQHASSYTWKRLGKPLNMAKTLDENGIVDDTRELQELGLAVGEYIPAVHVYFNDDLTIA